MQRAPRHAPANEEDAPEEHQAAAGGDTQDAGRRSRKRGPGGSRGRVQEEEEQEGAEDGGGGETAARKLQRAVKNRLSAARSRERRLAYTAELEAQVAALQTENEGLKRQLAAATDAKGT